MAANARPSRKAAAPYRFGRGWSAPEIAGWLGRLDQLRVTADDQAAQRLHYHSEAIIGREAPGPVTSDGGTFARARALVHDYCFSDPRIVRGHFDRRAPLRGRRMLLEIKVWGQRYLCGVVVGDVRDHQAGERSEWGFRYDTLEGHLETGSEWFLLSKLHATGEIRFRIEASWRPGQFPTWWSRVGFALLARRYQRAWHRLAYLRLRRQLGVRGLPALPRGARLLQRTVPTPQPPLGELQGKRPPPQMALEEVSS